MEELQKLLQSSALLYKYLTNIPTDFEREEYIDQIHRYLDERGHLIDDIQQKGIKLDPTNKTHNMLVKLDQGIVDRLNTMMKIIQDDLKELQTAKKSEKQYMNPYSNVQVMDGRYYDKKK